MTSSFNDQLPPSPSPNKASWILVTVSGEDQLGILNGLMEAIARAKGTIVDLSQSATHGLLSLSLVLKQDSALKQDEALFKELLFEAKKKDLALDFKVVDEAYVRRKPGTIPVILNCVARDSIGSNFLSELTGVLAKHNVNVYRIDNKTKKKFASIEMVVDVPLGVGIASLKNELFMVSGKHRIDIALIEDSLYRTHKRLIVFDMDSTLIQAELIDEMAKLMGVGEQVASITRRAMQGELDYKKSIRERVGHLRGLSVNAMEELASSMPITPGAESLVRRVHDIGYRTAIISGGFLLFARYLQKKLGIDMVFANEPEVFEGQLTGRVREPIIDAERKADLLQALAEQENISLKQVVAIGDGANDLLMLSKAGLGITFHAKKTVQRHAKHHLQFNTINSILYLLGLDLEEGFWDA